MIDLDIWVFFLGVNLWLIIEFCLKSNSRGDYGFLRGI